MKLDPNKKYKAKVLNKRRKDEGYGNLEYTNECVICKKPFISNRSDIAYCSDLECIKEKILYRKARQILSIKRSRKKKKEKKKNMVIKKPKGYKKKYVPFSMRGQNW